MYSKYSEFDKLVVSDYSSTFKTNELYNSNDINYRELLNDGEKKVYEYLISSIMNFNENVIFDLSFHNYSSNYEYIDCAGKISDAVIMDHPELIQYAYPMIYNDVTNGKVKLKLVYALSKNEYSKYVNIINKELNNIYEDASNLSEYEKVKYTYEYLANKNTYGDINDARSQSAYTAFINGINPVCSGYARASQLIFGKLGIHSLLVLGDLKSTWLTGDAHAWNIVKVNNNYYNYDVTQSSAFKSFSNKISYMGLLSMDKKSFNIRYKDVALYVKSNNLDYYKNNNLYYTFKVNNVDVLRNILNNTNDKYVEIKINNVTGFKVSYKDIKDELGVVDYRVIDDIIVFKKV